MKRRYQETDSDWVRNDLERYMISVPCPTCKGARLKPDSLAVTVDERSIVDVTRDSVGDALAWVARLQADPTPLSAR